MTALAWFCALVDGANRVIGHAVAWLAIPLVLLQFAVVVLRYAFGVGFVMLQESVVYADAVLLMLGAGFTLLRGGHVRVDIVYREARPRTRAWIDLFGALLLLLPVCVSIIVSAAPYVALSWSVLEGSRETSGIPAVFLLKSLIIVFAVLVGLQGLAMAGRAALLLAGVAAPLPPGDPHPGA